MILFVLFSVCVTNLDIAFIIDGSGSIRDANPADGSFDNWNLLLQFVAAIIRRLPVGQSRTRVAAVLFSDRGVLLFRLDRFNTAESAANNILRTQYPGANTNTSGGLWIARSEVFNPNHGDRPDVPNVAIIITDGKSTFDNQLTVPTAESLRSDGTLVLAIGVTSSVDEEELRAISSLPQREGQQYFTSPDFQQLDRIINGLLATACATSPRPSM